MCRQSFIAIVVILCLAGCTPVRRTGQLLKSAALVTTSVVAEGVFNSIFDDDEEEYSDQLCREEREQGWKEYWRANPKLNPAMTEAYANE